MSVTPVIEIHQQVHIARRTIVASGNAAEDAEVSSAPPLGRGEYLIALFHKSVE